MICPQCYGRRLFFVQGRMIPCPSCEGFGELHCCDGLQAQPGVPTEAAVRPAPQVIGARPVSQKVTPRPPLVSRR